MKSKLVYGVGIYEKGQYAGSVAGRMTREYHLWKNMLERCYSPRFQEKNRTYVGCSVSEGFKNFQYFAEWCNKQVGFGNMGWQLDKDLLSWGNKEYNESSCAFIPRDLNLLLISSGAARGLYPIGVHWCKRDGKFNARLSMNGKAKNLGNFDNPKEAFSVYKAVKEAHVKEVAEKYKYLIDSRVYDALMKWEVNINE